MSTRRRILPNTFRPQTLRLNLVPGREKGKRTFELYVVEISDMLVGSFDGEFWTRILVQRSCAEPAVWHSLLALTMLAELRLKERTTRGVISEASELQHTAMTHYNRSVQLSSSMASALSHEKVESLIINSLIFALIELTLVDIEKASLHLTGGARLIEAWLAENSAPQPHQRYLFDAFLKPMFDYMGMFLPA